MIQFVEGEVANKGRGGGAEVEAVEVVWLCFTNCIKTFVGSAF